MIKINYDLCCDYFYSLRKNNCDVYNNFTPVSHNMKKQPFILKKNLKPVCVSKAVCLEFFVGFFDFQYKDLNIIMYIIVIKLVFCNFPESLTMFCLCVQSRCFVWQLANNSNKYYFIVIIITIITSTLIIITYTLLNLLIQSLSLPCNFETNSIDVIPSSS